MAQILRFIPALRVHSWGGFGSQLFTVYVILKLQKRFPGRRIKVVIHTAGVTRRITEFNFEQLGVKVIQVEDYKNGAVDYESNELPLWFVLQMRKIISTLFIPILKWLHIFQTANSDDSFAAIRFWTLIVRGHFSKLARDKHLLENLFELIYKVDYTRTKNKAIFAIHYRLGDLLTISNKNPINVERIDSLLNQVPIKTGSKLLLTDSSIEDLNVYLEQSTNLRFFRAVNYDPVTTLWSCVTANDFVGTNSKISIWTTIFRSELFNKESFLPKELEGPFDTSGLVKRY